MTYDPQVDNYAFLQRIGILALTQNRGPLRAYNLNDHINLGYKVIDNVADIQAGDIANSGNKEGVVISNVLARGVRTITVVFRNIPIPAGVSNEDYIEDGLDKQTVLFTISEVETDGNQARVHNPYLVLASIGTLFIRNLNPAPPQNPEIVLDGAAPTIIEGGPATSLDFNVGGVSVQKTVNGSPSGSPVVANGSGVASIPNGNTAGQLIRFVVSKAGYNTKTFGPYTVGPATP